MVYKSVCCLWKCLLFTYNFVYKSLFTSVSCLQVFVYKDVCLQNVCLQKCLLFKKVYVQSCLLFASVKCVCIQKCLLFTKVFVDKSIYHLQSVCLQKFAVYKCVYKSVCVPKCLFTKVFVAYKILVVFRSVYYLQSCLFDCL